MGEIICKTKKYLGTQKLTPLQLLWVVVGIFFFIFIDTDIFQNLGDTIKIVIYASFVVVCILLGVSAINVKKIANDLKAIYVNKNMTAEQKVNAYGNLALTVLSQLGEAWELLNEEQFKDTELIGTTDANTAEYYMESKGNFTKTE